MFKWTVLFTLFELNHGLTTNNLLTKDDVIGGPLLVNCSEPVCVGPLSNIYCHGDILSAAWRLGLSDTCPGPKLRYPVHDVLANFRRLGYPLRREVMQSFCNDNFEEAEFLEQGPLVDWKQDPQFLTKIKDPKLRSLAKGVHQKWKALSRTFTKQVINDAHLFPAIPVKNVFIAPGGRFQTYFYWDTYWIIRGLLVSGMTTTVSGIIDNFASLVDRLGYIPNSGRLELSRRSQPPLFAMMVESYELWTGDTSKANEWLPRIEKEIQFWQNNRSIIVNQHTVYRYKTISNCPRSENFIADYNAGVLSGNPQKTWRALTSACESGWDFSSRWLGSNELKSIGTHEIIPVDLNVFLARAFDIASNLHAKQGNHIKANKCKKMGDELKMSIDDLFWNEKEGTWFDYNITASAHKTAFYPSNIFPLLLGDVPLEKEKRVETWIRKSGANDYLSGIPSSLPVPSKQQWDFPNVWAPNQWLFIQSLLKADYPPLKQIANEQTVKCLTSVYQGFVSSNGSFWEKYDATILGSPGGGGEYPVQEGFGWTNGAVLDLIWLNREQELLSGHEFFGGMPHVAIILSAATLFLLLALWFLLRAFVKRRNSREVHEDEDSEQPLLYESDEA